MSDPRVKSCPGVDVPGAVHLMSAAVVLIRSPRLWADCDSGCGVASDSARLPVGGAAYNTSRRRSRRMCV